MADIEIDLDGIADLEHKLARVDILDLLREPMYRAVLRLQSAMAKYPPPPPRSKYRRTGTLGRRWTHRVSEENGALIGFVGNNTMYGPYVQSDQFQAWMHKGRWQTDKEVAERERPAIISDFQQVINRALEDL